MSAVTFEEFVVYRQRKGRRTRYSVWWSGPTTEFHGAGSFVLRVSAKGSLTLTNEARFRDRTAPDRAPLYTREVNHYRTVEALLADITASVLEADPERTLGVRVRACHALVRAFLADRTREVR